MTQPSRFALTPAITIRDITPADHITICELAYRIWRAHYQPEIISSEQVEHMLKRFYTPASIVKNQQEKKQRWFLLEQDGELIGYTALSPLPQSEWFLDKLYVDTKKHRHGLGEMLLSHAINTLNPSALSLRVNRKNIKAINFYFKHGFTITALDVLEVGNGYVMDDFLMRRIL